MTFSNNNNFALTSTPTNAYSSITQSLECPISWIELDAMDVEPVIDPCGHTCNKSAVHGLKRYALQEGKYVHSLDGKFVQCPQQQNIHVPLDSFYPNPIAKKIAQETKVFLSYIEGLNSKPQNKELILEKNAPSTWPYSFKYMKKPVVDADGHTFDLVEAKEIIAENGRTYYQCPHDGKCFLKEQLYTNRIVEDISEKIRDLTKELEANKQSASYTANEIRTLEATVFRLTNDRNSKSQKISSLEEQLRFAKMEREKLAKQINDYMEEKKVTLVSLKEQADKIKFQIDQNKILEDKFKVQADKNKVLEGKIKALEEEKNKLEKRITKLEEEKKELLALNVKISKQIEKLSEEFKQSKIDREKEEKQRLAENKKFLEDFETNLIKKLEASMQQKSYNQAAPNNQQADDHSSGYSLYAIGSICLAFIGAAVYKYIPKL